MSPSNYAFKLPFFRTSILVDRSVLRGLPRVFPGRPCARFLTIRDGQSVCCILTTKTQWQALTASLCRKGTHLSALRQYYYSRKGQKKHALPEPKGRQADPQAPAFLGARPCGFSTIPLASTIRGTGDGCEGSVGFIPTMPGFRT